MGLRGTSSRARVISGRRASVVGRGSLGEVRASEGESSQC